MNNVLGGTSAMIFENIDQIVKIKPDCLVVHAWANQAEELVKQDEKVF